MATKEVRVPDIGDFENVEIIEVTVSAGDELSPEDPMITLETDKAAMEVPAPFGGKVSEVRVNVGDKVSKGDLIALVETDAADEADKGAETAAPATASGSAPVSRVVEVPDIGDFDNVEIIEVHVAEGDTVAAEDPLITLETDKAAMEVPSPAAGEVTALHVAVGNKVSQGDRILTMTASEAPPAPAQAAAAPQSVPEPVRQPAPKAPTGGLPPIDEQSFAAAHAGPSIRKFARELGVDLGRVRGSGSKGRITRDDVTAFVKAVMSGALPGSAAPALPQVPKVDYASFGEVETRKLTRIQKISGPRLHASWVNLPHVTQHDDADITDLEARRKALKAVALEQGAKLTPLAFFVKACVSALQEFPVFNSSLNAAGDSLVYKKYFNIGFAADTPDGLVVPVIRNADQKDLLEIARELGDMAGQARDGKLPGEAMRGGSFTISSLGGIGGTAFTPIINAPEVAILGISRAAMKPLWRDGKFEPRLIVPLSLSYDHRVIDGASAARFTTFLGKVLADADALIPDTLK